jgi:hypothetical protein
MGWPDFDLLRQVVMCWPDFDLPRQVVMGLVGL